MFSITLLETNEPLQDLKDSLENLYANAQFSSQFLSVLERIEFCFTTQVTFRMNEIGGNFE
jgi:hypothetical protein